MPNQSDYPRTLDQLAQAYVRLVLSVGLHDPDYVDAFYGPPNLKAEVDAENPSFGVIAGRAQEVLGALQRLDVTRTEEIVQLRHQYLTRQIQSLKALVKMLSGTRFSFDEESKDLYDSVAPTHSEQHFQKIIGELDALLPGRGSVPPRFEEYRKSFIIPRENLDAVFNAAIKEARERTKRRIGLPDNERFELEYVTGKTWSGYNWYKGGSHSLIQINTDFPITIDRAVDLASHEGYPGHHVYNALLEKELVRGRNWVEFSVYALFSPQSLIAEGTANYGIEMAFPGDERAAFEGEVLFPLGGLDASRAAEYYGIHALYLRLNYAGNEAARRYLDGTISREEAARWLVDYALYSPDRALQRTRFFDQYRSYVINYNLGQDLVGRYLASRGATPENPTKRWEEFRKLLASPRLPSGLAPA